MAVANKQRSSYPSTIRENDKFGMNREREQKNMERGQKQCR